MKKYNRTLLVALLIVAVFATAIGGTFAWFTDNVEVTGNVIESGTLDIDIELKKGDSWISLEKSPETKIYNYDLWEPGYTEMETLKIVNKGNLALEYILKVVPGPDEKKGPANESLADVIDVYMHFGEITKEETSREEIVGEQNGWWKAGNLADLIIDKKGFTQGYMLPSGKTDAPDGVLEVGLMQGSCTCTVALHMQESADNRYQNLSLGTVGFKLQAKQYTYEPDSFDNQYDKDAEYGEGSIVNDDTPQAVMTELEEDQLTVIFSDIYKDVAPVGTRIFGEHVLDCGVVLRALEDDATGSPYEDYYVDLLISCDKAITEDAEIVLGGHYDFDELATTGEWLGCNVSGLDVPANERIPVMGSLWGNPMRYYEIINNVKEFYCGVICSDFFNGSTITLELVMYEPSDTSYENPIVIGSPYTYTHN